jgi:hypothetical protein
MDYTDTYYLNIMSVFDGVIGNIIIKTYDINGNQLYSLSDTNPYLYPDLTGPTSANVVLSVGIGPLDINTRTQALISTPIIVPEVAYYTIQLKDVTNTDTTSEIFTVVMNSKKYYQRFRFRWLNSTGAFDSYTFEGRNSETKNVRNSTEYSKLLGKENPIGGYAYENGGRGRKTIYQSVETQYTVFSQFITEAESYWLNELFTSPEVYLEVVDTPKQFQTTYDYNGSGLLGISYSSPHYYKNDDLGCFIDCDDDANRGYAGITVIDDYNILAATSYVDIPNGFSFLIDQDIKLLPIMINSKTYNIKQGINPRNIQVQIDFTLALEDPKQRG